MFPLNQANPAAPGPPGPSAAAQQVPVPTPSQPGTAPGTAAPGAGTRLQTNRPTPIITPSQQPAPVRRGLFSFFRRGAEQPPPPPPPAQPALGPDGQPAIDPESGQPIQPGEPAVGPDGEPIEGNVPGQPSLMQNTAAERDVGIEVAMVSYDNSYKMRKDDPAVHESIILHFDVGRFSKVMPLKARETAVREGRFEREELGLYKEKQCILNPSSLNKTEQRIVKATDLDRNLLNEMAGGNAEAAAQMVAIMAMRRQQQEQEQAAQQAQAQAQEQQEQLKVGDLPTLAEEPEEQPEGAEIGKNSDKKDDDDDGGTGGEKKKQEPSPEQPQLPGQPDVAPAEAATQAAAGALAMPGGPPGPDEGAVMAPAPKPISDPLYVYEWLDENGLMVYVPDPLKTEKERPARRYDQDKEMIRTYVRRPIVENPAALRNTRLYRLDIELGRLEFTVHPAMAQEDLLAAKMLFLFREFKKREAIGLTLFYANRLAALEDSMLGAREKLFALQATESSMDDILDSYAMLAKIEREVAEVRQLKEEEEALLTRTVRAMEALFGQIQSVRQSQGYWLTNLVLTVQQLPPVEMGWQQGALTRKRLDALLLAAEMEEIAGLPKYPDAFPAPLMAELPGFPLRRVEAMCGAHGAILADVTKRLEVIKNRPSADPDDPVLKQLEDQAMLIGRAPRRVAMTMEEQVALQQKAKDMIEDEELPTGRLPRLNPILTIGQSPEGVAAAGGVATGGADAASTAANAAAATVQPATEQRPPGRPGAGKKGSGIKGKYFAKVFVNGHYVDTSEAVSLADNFVAQFHDCFSIEVARFPESICVQLFERQALRETYIAQFFSAIPGDNGTPHVDAHPRPYQFSALTPFRPRMPPGTGGPVPMTPDTQAPALNYNAVYPAGTLFVRCGWVPLHLDLAVGLADAVAPAMVTYENPLADHPDIEAGKDLMPSKPTITVDRMLRRAADRIGGKANRAQIMKWLAANIIDPNDPRNAPLMELLKTHEANTGVLGDLFRLDIFPDVAMRDDRTAEKRFNVMARRWQAGIYRAPEKSVLKGMRSVPIRAPLNMDETEHLDNQYLDQLALLEQASDGTQLALARLMMARHEKAMQLQIGAVLTNAIKEREERVRNFALRVRAAAARLAGGRTMARRFRTEDVVNDAPLPEFKLEMGAISKLLAPRRPLKRSRKLIKSLMTSVPRDTQLMVTIQRAANLPARGTSAPPPKEPPREIARERDRDRDGRDLLKKKEDEDDQQPRNCFVEVRFRGIAKRTVSVAGEFPLFNEQIDLDVFRDDGRDMAEGADDGSGLEPSPSALYENSDLITLNVFDEIIMERSEPITLRRREGEISDPVRLPQRERRFLGCMRVPLSSVYQLQVLEGTFKLEAPPVALGYVQTSERPATLTLYMTMMPRLAPPAAEIDERIISGEQEDVNRFAQRWLASLVERPESRARAIRAMAVDADGSALLMCRYVAPTHLPPNLAQLAMSGGGDQLPGVSQLEAIMLKTARFVAHVPYVDDSALQKRRNDIWTSSAEFLHLTGGDFEEHAHLLAGYFIQLGQQSFVVLGASTFGARTAFVLTTGLPATDPNSPTPAPPVLDLQSAPSLRMWNPLTGIAVAIKDPTQDMREVGLLYDNTNLWANIQQTGQPWSMKWNLNAHKEWLPFFGAAMPARELATIQTAPVYEELDVQFYQELEGRIEKKVEETLSAARATGAFVTRPDNKTSRLLKQLLKELPKAHEAIAAASLAASAALAEAQGKGPTDNPQRLGERHKLISGLQASHNARIQREAKAESANGHILALPFSDRYLEAIGDAVLNTGIHRIADERVKYSTAVYVEPLGASFVCCIWIYVAAIRG